MRLVETATVKAGSVLAKSIFNDKGQTLLSEGIALNERTIQRLCDKGIHYIYIKDPNTEDIVFEEPISRKLKSEAITIIEKTFEQIQDNPTQMCSTIIEKNSKTFMDIVRNILSEIESNEDLLTVLLDAFVYDDYIFTHSFNVTMYSLAIGLQLKLSPKELETLGVGAILHDVGKIKIPEEILFKPGKLTCEEFEIVKRHPKDGFDMLRGVHNLSLMVAHCAYQHHERLDGSGYPRGLKGKDIHLFGKIIAVADVFDAVTSNRVYRKALLPSTGMEILYGGAGTIFETEIVNAFRKSVAIYPVGMSVELNDGRKGIVSRQNKGIGDRPIIRIFEEKGRKVKPYEVNLLHELSVIITKCHMSA